MTGDELRAWREHWQLSQGQLARLLDVHINTVGKWEREEREIPGFLALALKELERRQAADLRQRARGQRVGAGKTRREAALEDLAS